MRALEGLRVLDLSRFQACPVCGMMLADFGAEVIRIEQPDGAPDRTWGQLGPDGETLLYKIVCRNKKAVTLRMENPEGLEIFQELVRHSDVLLHNFTPGAPVAQEVSYDRLKEINPRIIVAAVSGYGQTGPDAEKPCFDAVAQARSGAMVLNGFPDDPPLKTTVTHIDVSTGLMAAIGVLVALHHRERTGLGQAVDVSLFDTASFATQALGTLLLHNLFGEIRTQVGNRGFHSYAGCHKAKGKWVMINPATNTIWKRFTRAIGQPAMAEDTRFATDMDRFRNAALIDPVVKEWVEQRTAAEILGVLDKARIPCSAVNTIDEALQDPQVAARDMIAYLDYPDLGTLPIPGLPIKLSLTPGSINSAAPRLGEHNQDIYCGLLGFTPEKLARLKTDGII
jgi:crotonobetainyl-CoA:carnitine CoA-transferase CaiB-like acyl-CoA transferase